MITEINGKCQFENCTEPATHIACGRSMEIDQIETQHPEPACYCKIHARQVADENYPEYNDVCPNCGCLFGVN